MGATNMSIIDLKPGQSAVIESLKGNNNLIKRLMALGYIKGTKVTVKAFAPLGDPIIINSRGFNLALRKDDAKNIIVKEV